MPYRGDSWMGWFVLAFPSFDSIRAHWGNDKLSIVAIAVVALAAAGIGMMIAHRWEASKREDLMQVLVDLASVMTPKARFRYQPDSSRCRHSDQ